MHAKYKYLKRASQVPPTEEEKNYFPQQILRRCPNCLSAVPGRATKCFICWGILLTEDAEASKEVESKKALGGETKEESDRAIFPVRRDHDYMLGDQNTKIPLYGSRSSAIGAGDERSLDNLAFGTPHQLYRIECQSWNKAKQREYLLLSP